MPDGRADRLSNRQTALRIAIGAGAVIAAVLGVIGFVLFLPTQPAYAGWGWTDVLYYTLQLFLLDASPLQSATRLNPVLEVARFLAPATTAATLGASILAVYNSTYHAVRTRRLQDHTVVCGDGVPALRVARGVLDEDRSCVIVSPSSSGSQSAPGEREDAVLRMGGDPRDADVLREARIDRAREIVVITGDNDRNTDVAASIRTALREVAAPPACFLEMGSPELALALAAHEINSGTAVRTEFFDPVDRGARRLLETHLPRVGGSVVLVGAGRQHDALRAALERRDGVAPSIPWTALDPGELVGYQPPGDLAVALVTAADDAASVRLGLDTLQTLRDTSVNVVVATGSRTALGSEVDDEDAPVSTIGRARLIVFNVADHVYTLESLRDGIYYDMARAAHEAYVAQARLRGETEHTNPSTLPWGRLPADLQRANIRQAYSVGEKLRAEKLAVVPTDGRSSSFTFEGAELERLAQGEHERWCRERVDAGWTEGPRDDDAKKHPDLVPWPKLSSESQQKDVDAVAAIPHQLRRVGLQIVRVGG